VATAHTSPSLLSKPIGWADYLCVASVIGLLSIWVLPDTIALRHVLIITGFLSACRIISTSTFFKERRFFELLPLIFLSFLFVWVVVHYFFFSLNPTLEAQEIRSLWLRSFLCAVMAVGLRISIANHPPLQPYFFAALWVVPLINLGAYLALSAEAGRWLSHFEFVVGFVFKKIEAAFFGVLAIAIACANLIDAMSHVHERGVRKKTLWYGLGIGIALLSALVTGTKNGVVAGLSLCVVLAFAYLFHYMRFTQSNIRIRALAFAIIILLGAGLVWKGLNSYSAATWNHLLEDVRIASQVDTHSVWKKNNPTQFPLAPSGRMVTGNTYERVAWATMGLRLIEHYPYGSGSVNRSFVLMLNHAGVEHQLESQTHSGWIDFGLGFGIPGLAILGFVFMSCVWFAIRQKTLFGLLAIWLTIALVPFGLIAEITYKHNFEILIFFIAFASASAIVWKPSFLKS